MTTKQVNAFWPVHIICCEVTGCLQWLFGSSSLPLASLNEVIKPLLFTALSSGEVDKPWQH